MSVQFSFPPSLPCDKFRNFRHKRFHNPNNSLDPPKIPPIPDLKKLKPQLEEPFFIEKFHQIKPKKLSANLVKRAYKIQLCDKSLNNNHCSAVNQELTVNESRISVDQINVSKISTQDTNKSNSFINRANACFYQGLHWKRSKSLISGKKIVVEMKKKNGVNENVEPMKACDKNEMLLGKIRTVFKNFKEKQEEILRVFNNERRNRLKGVVRCPKLTEL